jgi:L-ascorbate metabolism protein UlaG (beta-lactamase superfamily)
VALCHLGDLGHKLTTEQAEEIGIVDVLMLPVGGVSTIGAETAAEVMRQLEPQVVIPMHYGTPAISRQLDPVEKFLKELGMENLEPRPKLSVSKTGLVSGPQVVLLDYSA